MGGIGRSVELINSGKNLGVVQSIRRCLQTKKGLKSLKHCIKLPEDFKADLFPKDEMCVIATDGIETQMEVKLRNGEIISVVSYGSDNWITPYVNQGDRVALIKIDSYGALWGSLESTKLGFVPESLKLCKEQTPLNEVGI